MCPPSDRPPANVIPDNDLESILYFPASAYGLVQGKRHLSCTCSIELGLE